MSRRIASDLRPLTIGLTAGLVTWFGVTVLSQHPQQAFDRFRRYDVAGLMIGNWRFFAPEPAQHDFHLLHRVLTADDEQTPWVETIEIPRRTWRQMVWFPERRQDKAIFDICVDLIGWMARPDTDLTTTPAYEVLRDLVAEAVLADRRALSVGVRLGALEEVEREERRLSERETVLDRKFELLENREHDNEGGEAPGVDRVDLADIGDEIALGWLCHDPSPPDSYSSPTPNSSSIEFCFEANQKIRMTKMMSEPWAAM